MAAASSIPIPQRHFVVGDIQGCSDALQHVLGQACFDPQVDCLWCVGDLVNRGGQSATVLEFIYQLPHKRVVLGNHDVYLLLLWQNRYLGKRVKKAELREVIDHPACDAWLGWLLQQPFVHSESINGHRHTMVHAGIPHMWNLATALELSQAASAHISCPNGIGTLWSDSPRTFAATDSTEMQLTYVVNAFTRMRQIRDDGKLNFSEKSRVSKRDRYQPWFDYMTNAMAHPIDGDVYFGHWAALKPPLATPIVATPSTRMYATDHGFVWGGALKLMNLETKEVFLTKHDQV